ncbi:MAG: hypothetical protein R3B71_01585 [Candidatus Gracilibacteria bacterium]
MNNFNWPISTYLNPKEGYDFMFELLCDESPRVVKRCTEELKFFYQTYTNIDGKPIPNAIVFCDILGLAYIKVKYPFVIDFFLKTVDHFGIKTEMSKFIFDQMYERKDRSLGDWIEEESGLKLNDFERDKILALVALVAWQYNKLTNRDSKNDDPEVIVNRTSYYKNLRGVLSFIGDSEGDHIRKYHKIYLEHQRDDELPKDLTNINLLDYSHSLLNVEGCKQIYRIQVLEEILRRLIDGEIKLQLSTLEETEYKEAVYEFVFQCLETILRDRSEGDPLMI